MAILFIPITCAWRPPRLLIPGTASGLVTQYAEGGGDGGEGGDGGDGGDGGLADGGDPSPEYPPGLPQRSIHAGDYVTYNGGIFCARYWTQNQGPRLML